MVEASQLPRNRSCYPERYSRSLVCLCGLGHLFAGTPAPLTYDIEGNIQVVDTFGRAKDLLNIFFPLFGAVVTFWLGVAVEGRRADHNEAEAKQAKVEKEAAEVGARKAHNAAVEALDEAGAAVLKQMQTVDLTFDRGGGERGRASHAALENALQAIRMGRQKLYR